MSPGSPERRESRRPGTPERILGIPTDTMTTNPLTDVSRPGSPIPYAWVVLATTTLVLLASGGVRAAIGVFVKPLEAEFGWSRTALSFAVAVSIALYGLTGPFVGRLADKWGPRWVLTA